MAPRFESPEQPTDGEAGVSLVEIVVAMFLFAVMSVAVLPLMIGAVQASVSNRDLVAANSLANAQLAMLQDTFPTSAVSSDANSCTAVWLKDGLEIVDQLSGTIAKISVGTTCPTSPTSYPTTVAVTVRGFRPNSTKATVILTSAILVTSP